MQRTRSFALAAVAALVLSMGLPLAYWPSDARASANCDVAGSTLNAAEQRMVDLVNQARAAGGLVALVPAPSLNRSAAWKSADPSGGDAGFSHTDSLGRDPFKRMADCGYSGGGGENIAWGSSDPEFIFSEWMASPGHHAAIMMASFRAIGVGLVGAAWTMDFGYTVEAAQGASPAITVAPVAPMPTIPGVPLFAYPTVATPTATPPPAATPSPAPRQRSHLVLPMVAGLER